MDFAFPADHWMEFLKKAKKDKQIVGPCHRIKKKKVEHEWQ